MGKNLTKGLQPPKHSSDHKTVGMAASTSDHEQIRNVISNIAISFDTNEFHQLRESFVQDCSADHVGSLGLIQGIDKVIKGLQDAIGHIATFHGLSTQAICLTGMDTAEATTYCSASHFLSGKSFFAEARYVDQLVRVASDDGSRKWLIKSRYVAMMGVPRGDVSIFNLDLDQWVESLKQ
jgi:hypothetical protein